MTLRLCIFVRDLNPSFPDGDIEFVPATGEGIKSSPTRLPAVVNTSLDESQPALTPDGRFIAFVRHGVDGHDRLFLWDSQPSAVQLKGSGPRSDR